jgi:Fur family peroxide stress response transcriptional regulator
MEITTRETKYCQMVRDVLGRSGHATNSEIVETLRADGVMVSDTTIHRVTKRLTERGAIALAPSNRDGAMRYDSRTEPHHHFVCESCETLCDILPDEQTEQAISLFRQRVSGCDMSGTVTITGMCKKCQKGV